MNLSDLYNISDYKNEFGMLFNNNALYLLSILDDNSIDLIVTDPPYKTTKRGTTGNTGGMLLKENVKKGKIFEHNEINIKDYSNQLYRILKQNSHCYIMTNHINLIEILNEMTNAGFHFIKSIIWNKGNKIMGQFYMSQFEYILFFRKGKAKKINNCGTSDIISIPNKKTKDEKGNNLHDTEKPVELMKILIENSSNEQDIVLDPFVGIGATCIASQELNRRFVGCELDENYFNIAKNRLKNL